jgi:6-phosphogluconolactonase
VAPTGLSEPVVHPDLASLQADAAERFAAAAALATADRGRFDVVLTGGSTVPGLYARLAAEPLRRRIDWERVHVWWTDERCVPPDDPLSNYGAAREILLDRVPIPCEQIHRMRGEDPNPEREAVRYEAALRREHGLAPGEAPRFDLALFGLGGDTHVASLFPGAPTLQLDDRLVAAVRTGEVAIPSPCVNRITLTFRALNAAGSALFLVAGEGKAEAVRAVLAGPRDPVLHPAQGIRPAGGETVWLVDRPAASLLGP